MIVQKILEVKQHLSVSNWMADKVVLLVDSSTVPRAYLLGNNTPVLKASMRLITIYMQSTFIEMPKSYLLFIAMNK